MGLPAPVANKEIIEICNVPRVGDVELKSLPVFGCTIPCLNIKSKINMNKI